MTELLTAPGHAPPLYLLQYEGDVWVDEAIGQDVLKNFDDNLEARKWIVDSCAESPKMQAEQLDFCRQSPLYWINYFAWTFVIRKHSAKGRVKRDEFEQHVPFITWPVQDAAISDIIDCIEGGQDVIVDKSRDMGASWILILLAVYYWLFVDDAQIGCCSRIEDDVDLRGSMKTLFGKIDYVLRNLPEWMLPHMGQAPSQRMDLYTPGKGNLRTHMRLARPDSEAFIRGEATTGHLWRGDRLTWGFLDEMAAQDSAEEGWASAADATDCRIGNSTPIGPGTKFTRERNNGIRSGTPRVITLGYWNHPDKGEQREWRIDEDGDITNIAGRGFWWTPWFQREVDRRQDPRDVGQNLLIDHTTSGDLFFNSTIVTQHMQTCVREPKRYEILMEDGEARFVPDEHGRWFLWFTPDDRGHVPIRSNFCAFCDLAHGVGAANSVAAYMNVNTGEIVGEFADANTSTFDFAEQVAIAGKHLFAGNEPMAFLGYEANGPGTDWWRDLRQFDYGHIYFRRRLGQRVESRTKEYGWNSNRTTKRALLTGLSRAMKQGEITIHSMPGLDEMLEYVFFDDGSIGPGMLQDTTTGAREAHGDRVIAYAGCVFMRAEMPKFEAPPVEDQPGTFGHFLGMEDTWQRIESGEFL